MNSWVGIAAAHAQQSPHPVYAVACGKDRTAAPWGSFVLCKYQNMGATIAGRLPPPRTPHSHANKAAVLADPPLVCSGKAHHVGVVTVGESLQPLEVPASKAQVRQCH